MAKILTFEIPEHEYNEIDSLLDSCILEIRQSREKMQKDQEEIDFLKNETRKVANDTRKVLAELEIHLLKVA